MGKQMLKNDEWNRNVGSPAFPVSLLHEYAVGLIWERLHGDDPVTVRMMNGELSGDLRDGMRYVQPGRPNQTIAGQVPDLVIYDAQLNPVRVIEVTVTSPLTADKRSRYENLDIEVVEVPIRTEADLVALYLPAFPHGIPWGSINEKRYRDPDPFAFGRLYIEERIIRMKAGGTGRAVDRRSDYGQPGNPPQAAAVAARIGQHRIPISADSRQPEARGHRLKPQGKLTPMLSIELIRNEADAVRAALVRRAEDDDCLDQILLLDAQRRAAITQGDELRSRRNQVSRAIGLARSQGQPPPDDVVAEMRAVGQQISALEDTVRAPGRPNQRRNAGTPQPAPRQRPRRRRRNRQHRPAPLGRLALLRL